MVTNRGRLVFLQSDIFY